MKTLVGTPDPPERPEPWWSWATLTTNSAPTQVIYTTITPTTYSGGTWT